MKLAARIVSFSMGAAFALSPLFAYASPLTISSCNDLEKIASSSYPSYTASSSYVLTQNIDCSATATQNPNGSGGYYGFTPIPDFTGTFNGAGYTISNLYISTTTINVGLFSILDGTSTVQNLTLSGGSVTGGEDVGALAGEMLATSTVQNLTSSVPVHGTQSNTAGLVGYGGSANTTISSSSVSGAVSVGGNYSDYIGGLVGQMLGTISNASASAPVTITGNDDEYIGDLAGSTSGPVSNSFATGNVNASTNYNYYVGGLIGYSSGAVTNTYATGSVTGGYEVDDVGGLIGENDSGNVASSSATGVVTGGTYSENLGGLLGYSEGAITNSFATGNVVATSSSEDVGGFDGVMENGSINQCYATGNVYNAGEDVGGFVGYNEEPITQSFSTGNLYLNGDSYVEYAGGFAGYTEAATTNDYETGNIVIDSAPVNNVYYVGGFTGYTGGPVTNVYSAGLITGPGSYSDVGGFVGYNEEPILNSFSISGGTALTGTTTASIGYFIGNELTQGSLTNVAELVQGAPAVGEDNNYSGAPDALLATHGYGTDESTLSNFYSTTEPVYAQATSSNPWNFSSIWAVHANALPTFQWYSGATPTYTITATAGTGGIINNSGAFSVLGGANQTYNIIPNNGYTITNVLVDGTSVGAVSTYTFSNVAANHTISVTFTTPTLTPTPTPTTTGSGGGSYGGGTVQNQVTNLITNGNTSVAAALEQKYPTLFANGTGSATTATEYGTSVASDSNSASNSNGSFTRSLTLGMTGADVKALQKYLNAHGFTVAASGAGSSGNETTYFGKATRAALAKFQKAHGITPAAGYFGSITRAYTEAHP